MKRMLLLVLLSGCATAGPKYAVFETTTGAMAHQPFLPALVFYGPEMPAVLVKEIREAIAYWNSVDDREYFALVGELPPQVEETSHLGRTILYLVPGTSIASAAAGRCGLATMSINMLDGVILASEVRLADSCSGPPDGFETVVRHELGHVLGLEHNTIDKESVMAPSIRKTEKFPKDATRFDLAGLVAIYGESK